MEMTTGMSAPPIAATRWKPRNSEITVSRINGNQLWEFANHTPQAMIAITDPRLIQFRPGSSSGLDGRCSDSLPQATIDPVKVTAPMNTPIHTSYR